MTLDLPLLPLRLCGLAALVMLASPVGAQETAPETETAPASPPPPPPLHETPPLARAAAPYVPPATTPEPVGGFGANLGVGFGFISTPPDLTLTTPDGGAMKQFSGFPVEHLAATYTVDLSISAFYRTASPIVIPLLGFEIGIPVSTGYPGSVPLGAKPGSLTWLRGGPTYSDGLDILGVGLVFATGTFRFGFDMLPGFRYFYTTGTITQGLLTIDAEARQYTFSLHADASMCAGAKGAASVCVFAAPHVFEFGHWVNGAVFGARVETN
jgi:hypothetical protein